jgi:6-phosphogluconolactonase
MEIHTHLYESDQLVAEAFAAWLADWIDGQEAERPLHLALSGGSTPKILFEHLATHYATALPWSRLHLWWGDERCVPPDSPESNYHMTQQYLISQVELLEENIHRIKGEEIPIDEAKRYAQEMVDTLPQVADIPQFDLIMLGMGDDGHTASIFPDQMALLESEALTAVATHPSSHQQRVTFTGKLLNQAANVAFLVTGTKKSGRIAQILGGRPGARHLPAYHIKPTEGVLHWFLDRAAASDIRG